jgi:hypothetical protein
MIRDFDRKSQNMPSSLAPVSVLHRLAAGFHTVRLSNGKESKKLPSKRNSSPVYALNSALIQSVLGSVINL